jgi:hypothetical protein
MSGDDARVENVDGAFVELHKPALISRSGAQVQTFENAVPLRRKRMGRPWDRGRPCPDISWRVSYYTEHPCIQAQFFHSKHFAWTTAFRSLDACLHRTRVRPQARMPDGC